MVHGVMIMIFHGSKLETLMDSGSGLDDQILGLHPVPPPLQLLSTLLNIDT